MKRILFGAPNLTGHTNQLLYMAEDLVADGHAVSFANGRSYRERIEALGAEFIEWDEEGLVSDPQILARNRRICGELSRLPEDLFNGVESRRRIVDIDADLYPFLYAGIDPLFATHRFDLVVVDFCAYPLMDRAAQAGIPVVSLAQYLGDLAPGAPGEPVFPSPLPRAMDLSQRVQNQVCALRWNLDMRRPLDKLRRIRREVAARHGRSLEAANPLLLISSPWGFEVPHRLPLDLEMVGPILPRNKQALSPELAAWLEREPGRPVAYASLGTLAELTAGQALALHEGFRRSGHRVLWSLRADQQRLLGDAHDDAIRIEPTVPQLAVLDHPAVDVFITHCGMNSVTEGLVYGKPMLCIPFFEDQPYNAARVIDLGAGLRLSKDRLTPERVVEGLGHLRTEPSFGRRARELAVRQRAARGRERAVDILRAVLAVGSHELIGQPTA